MIQRWVFSRSTLWSTENRPASGDDDYDDGQIGSTFYQSEDGASPKGMYVLGDDGVDTDEYDTHVLAHEFMHFIEYTIGRSDSIGGVHARGDKLDLRVAFSEGFGNAFSGMALGDPVYRDSQDAAQGDGFDLTSKAMPGRIPAGSARLDRMISSGPVRFEKRRPATPQRAVQRHARRRAHGIA